MMRNYRSSRCKKAHLAKYHRSSLIQQRLFIFVKSAACEWKYDGVAVRQTDCKLSGKPAIERWRAFNFRLASL